MLNCFNSKEAFENRFFKSILTFFLSGSSFHDTICNVEYIIYMRIHRDEKTKIKKHGQKIERAVDIAKNVEGEKGRRG